MTADGEQLRVLVVDDDGSVREVAARSLESEGFRVQRAADLEAARFHIASSRLDAIVLDIELPDGSGYDLLREIIQTAAAPVIMLTSRQAEVDRVLGLELGADDYLVKPFFPRELVARVRKLTRRNLPSSRGLLEFDSLTVNLRTREVLVAERPVQLTSREFELLAFLARSPRTVFSRADLLREVWHSEPDWQSSRTVTEHIRRVRLKIETDPTTPRWIHTVGTSGYRFEP
jgi:DNA-binding response OmpR family regulator